jgi:hypothetical protein
MFQLRVDGRNETPMQVDGRNETLCMHSSSLTWFRHLSGNGHRRRIHD